MKYEFYLVIRFVHLFSYAVFIGSIVTILVGKSLADSRLSRSTLSENLSLIATLDKFVTAPAAIILGVTGTALAIAGGASLSPELWIVLLAFSWVLGFMIAHIWSIPRLKQLIVCAQKIESSNDYDRLSKEWFWINVLLLSLLVAASLIAEFKPGLVHFRQLFELG